MWLGHISRQRLQSGKSTLRSDGATFSDEFGSSHDPLFSFVHYFVVGSLKMAGRMVTRMGGLI